MWQFSWWNCLAFKTLIDQELHPRIHPVLCEAPPRVLHFEGDNIGVCAILYGEIIAFENFPVSIRYEHKMW